MINKLNEKQIALLEKYRDDWLSIGLSTNPFDKGLAEAAIKEAYQCAGLKEPKIIIHLGSPFSGAIGAAILDQVRAQVRDQVRDQVGDQVRAQVRDQVRDQVWAQVRDQVWDQVRDQVGDQVRAQVRDQVWDQVGDQVWAQVRDQVGDQVRDQVRDQVWAQVWAQVGDQVWDQVWAQVWAQVGDQVWRAGYGLHDANWLAFYNYFHEVCGLKCCKKLSGLWKTAKASGWWWPFDNAVIITPKPTKLSRDDQGRLHSTTGKSIEYPDGWGIYAVNGVRVPDYVITDPAQITTEEIESESNAEIRRVMIERYGQSRYLMDSGAKEIHRDDFGILYRKEIQGDEPLVMVKVVNSTTEADGTSKDYFLRVPPNVKTAHEAVAWTFEKTENNYSPSIET